MARLKLDLRMAAPYMTPRRLPGGKCRTLDNVEFSLKLRTGIGMFGFTLSWDEIALKLVGVTLLRRLRRT